MSSFPKKQLTVGGDDPLLPSLLAAINHATDISITTAFIRMTGIKLIKNALEDALNRKAKVRILTSDYLGITDPDALRYFMLLKEQGAKIKVFESAGETSFHMKAYLFLRSSDRDTSEGCAFIGSSNISQAALLNGLEWNLKIDKEEDEERFAAILKEYEYLYNDARCKDLSHQWIADYVKRLPSRESVVVSAPGQEEFEPPPTPSPIQKEALDALNNSREQGCRRGLVVMATGLGKTWLAAFDSLQINAKRVLFVAHREEILNQAEETFIRIRPDAKVGRYDGKQRDLNVDMLFASIQTIGRVRHLHVFGGDYFDYIVIDEFHHASARTYQQLLAHFTPRFLLGLTATPDRTDQSDILALCDDNLVFNKDLFDGINSKLLCPFFYYGVADVVDYQEIKWRSGKFDPDALLSQLATRGRAKHNLEQWLKYRQSRTLAFCISQKHADFMADYFAANGVVAVSVHSESQIRRNEALDGLRSGEIEVVFSVDLFNEGVDLPAIDTVLMLRPTESKIVFLQQLGRGLRKSPETDKERLVVLDFIGNHESFFRKPEALFGVGVSNSDRQNFIKQLKDGGLPLPEGCFVNYDLEAIDFMDRLTANNIDQQVDVYRSLCASLGHRPTMREFYSAGGSITTVRSQYGQWFEFLKSEDGLTDIEKSCFEAHRDFFLELEITRLVKSFKLVMLEALIELNGFHKLTTTQDLALKSYEVLRRRPVLIKDLPSEYQKLESLSQLEIDGWHKYWLKNPINAWVGGSSNKIFFLKDREFIHYCETILEHHIDTFMLLVQEIVDYRFLGYEARLASKGVVHEVDFRDNSNNDLVQIPFFGDLKIACGHFRSSAHESENIEYHPLPSSFGSLSPSRHFLARAKGNSMNGGKSPILDGDLLLLEVVTPQSAGSISNQIVAIEKQDVSGDDQYLLRYVTKNHDGDYILKAHNPEYSDMVATDDMRTFARLKSVVDSSYMFLHHAFKKSDVPGLFGLDYVEGLWKMPGHVCPANSKDQFLFVTLNKQGADKDYKYHDYFIDNSHFHWQSQNRTSPENEKGQKVIRHISNQSDIHLFVRKHPKISGKGAPFYYCGKLIYISHSGSAPMDVDFELESPLPKALFEMFVG